MLGMLGYLGYVVHGALSEAVGAASGEVHGDEVQWGGRWHADSRVEDESV